MSKFTLMQGDCLQVMDELISRGVKVNAVITDPPFGTIACKWDSVIPFDEMWTRLNKLAENSPIVLFGCEPFSSYLRISNIKNYKYDWIWSKNTGSNFFHAKRMPIRYTENMHVFIKGSSKYNPQKTTGHIPTNSGIGSNTGNVYSGKSKVNYLGGDTTRFPKNILEFNTVDNYSRVHPSQKPVELLEYLIRTYTNEGDTVLDFTMGSGTTGVACANTNRNFIGIELDEKYFNIAKERIETAYQQKEKYIEE